MQTTITSFNHNELPKNSNCIEFNPFLLALLPSWLFSWWGLLIYTLIILLTVYGFYRLRQQPSQLSAGVTKPKALNGNKVVDFSDRPDAEDKFVEEVQIIIENHLTNPRFNVRDLCKQLGMSHSQLHRKLTGRIGLPASKLIKSIKINKAKTLLQNPDLTITAVAYDSGFNDPDYFHRVFKQEVGITPTQFRESMG